jgi:xanthine/uracil/vitamin C permease (AzgA family)
MTEGAQLGYVPCCVNANFIFRDDIKAKFAIAIPPFAFSANHGIALRFVIIALKKVLLNFTRTEHWLRAYTFFT